MYKDGLVPFTAQKENDLTALGVNLTDMTSERESGQGDECGPRAERCPLIDVEGIYIAGYDAYANKGRGREDGNCDDDRTSSCSKRLFSPESERERALCSSLSSLGVPCPLLRAGLLEAGGVFAGLTDQGSVRIESIPGRETETVT